MNASDQIQLSRFDFAEFIEPGFAAVIPAHPGKLKLPGLPMQMQHRCIYVYLEALVTVVGSDFDLNAQVELIRNGHILHTIPAGLANNTGSILPSQTRFTAFPNVAAGTPEGLYAVFSQPLAGGASNATLTPQKVQMEIDELRLSILGSQLSAGTFASWRGILACRSSLVAL